MMAATAHLRLFAVLTARAINASSKSCPVWIQEKGIQRVKTEKSLSYGDARKLVKSSSSSVAPSYDSAAKTSHKKVFMECQTFSFWIGPQPSLREASRLPSVQTANAGSGTHDTTSSSSHQTKTNVRNESPAKSDTWSQQKKQEITITPNYKPTKHISQNIESENRYKSLAPDTSEDMDTLLSPRPARSKSRSRNRSKNISPIKHQ